MATPSEDLKNVPYLERRGILSKPEYYMAVAHLSEQRSKDPKTQVGACIVNQDERIISVGYNGMPNGCNDKDMCWEKYAEGQPKLRNKLLYVCHAELNAICNKYSYNLEGCTMYVTLFPCNECAKLIIQSGIKKLIYLRDTKSHTKSGEVPLKASKLMLEIAGVTYEKFESKQKDRITISWKDEKKRSQSI